MRQSRHLLAKLAFDAVAVSNPGRVRDHNEDNYLISPRLAMYAVCDGMGGHQAGELASEIAVETIPRAFVASQSAGLDSPEKLLTDAIYAAHKAIQASAEADAARLGMGTTAVIIWAPPPGDVLWVAHVGDSRAYLFRAGNLQHLTEDHTWFNQVMRAGVLPTNPDDWPNRHVLSQAVGASSLIAPEVSQLTLQTGDMLLLCSDGLTDMLDDAEITRQLSAPRSLVAMSQSLVNEANRRGGKDNITVILVRVSEPAQSGTATAILSANPGDDTQPPRSH
jgi:serine/threonine protein phosphatase PrpC